MIRGQDEPVPPPPNDLPSRPLPLAGFVAGPTLFRIHRAAYAPVYFSPGRDRTAIGRFDSLAGHFGVLYAALSFAGALVEVLLRKPGRRRIGIEQVWDRALSTLQLGAEVSLVDLTGPGLSQLGLDARMVSGGYEACGSWADALHAHPTRPGGILYPSRFDPSERCVALFEGTALTPVGEPVPLGTMLREVGAVLDRYGKALDAG